MNINLNFIDEVIKNDDVETLNIYKLKHSNEFKKNAKLYVSNSIQFDSINILKYLVKCGYFPSKCDFGLAIFWEKQEIIKYLFSIRCEYNQNIISLNIHHCSISTLKLLLDNGLIINKKDIIVSAREARGEIILFLLERGYKLEEAPSFNTYINEKKCLEMLELYHNLKISGLYQKKCEENKCIICYKRELFRLWKLEPEWVEYNNYIQLLSRELLEDLSELLLNSELLEETLF